MRYVLVVGGLINEQLPLLTICRMVQFIPVSLSGGFSEKCCILISIIDLDGLNSGDGSQVSLQPFTGISTCSTPVCFDAFIHSVVGIVETAKNGRNHHRFFVIEQHPSSESAFGMINRVTRQVMGIITKSRIAVHHTVIVESGWPDTEPAFKIILHTNRYGRHMPIFTLIVLKSGAMSCSPCKSSCLDTQGVRLILYIIKGTIAYSHTICITTEFRTWTGILKIILALVLGHPCTLDETIQKSIIHILSETVPTITPAFKSEHLFPRSNWLERLPV